MKVIMCEWYGLSSIKHQRVVCDFALVISINISGIIRQKVVVKEEEKAWQLTTNGNGAKCYN